MALKSKVFLLSLFVSFASGASALTEVQRMQRVYADLNNIKHPDQVPLDAAVLSYDVYMVYPPWYMQAFITVSNEYEDLGFPEFDLGKAGSIYEQGKICSDKSVQCAAEIISEARK